MNTGETLTIKKKKQNYLSKIILNVADMKE